MKILSLAGLLWLWVNSSVFAQGSRPAPATAEAAAAYLWNTILTTCPVPKEPGKTVTFYSNPAERTACLKVVPEYRFNDGFREILHIAATALAGNSTAPAAPETFNQDITPVRFPVRFAGHRFQKSG